MKKILGIILFIMPAFLVSGQVSYNDSREDFLAALQQNKNFRNHIAASNIALVQTFGYSHNDPRPSLIYETKYDKRGNNTDWIVYNRGKVKIHNSWTYDDSNRVTSFASYNGSGKLKRMNKNTYDKAGNIIEQDAYKKNPNAINSKTIKTYDSRNNITESKKIDKKGNLKSRIEYTYYEDGSKKQTIQYSGKGKVLRIWNFDCNPVGKPEAKKFKDTSKICIHYETDKDGNPIKVKEEYMGEGGTFGRTIRNVTKYDKDNNIIDVASYNLNGKQVSHLSATFYAPGKISEYIMYRGGSQKIMFRITYTYNTGGDIAESVIYKKSQVPFTTMKYVYSSSLTSPAK